MKCINDTENIGSKKLEQKMVDYLCSQNILFVELKVKICKKSRSKSFID